MDPEIITRLAERKTRRDLRTAHVAGQREENDRRRKWGDHQALIARQKEL